MTANARFAEEMLTAFWLFLAADARYAALGLHEFRLFDGRALTVDERGRLNDADLPALVCGSILPATEPLRVEPLKYGVKLTLDMALVTSAKSTADGSTTTPHSALYALATTMALMDIIDNRLARQTRLSAQADINDFRVTWDGLQAVSDPASRRVLYWDSGFTVELRRTRQTPAA